MKGTGTPRPEIRPDGSIMILSMKLPAALARMRLARKAPHKQQSYIPIESQADAPQGQYQERSMVFFPA